MTDVLKKSESDNIVEFSSVDEIVADLRIGKMVIIILGCMKMAKHKVKVCIT